MRMHRRFNPRAPCGARRRLFVTALILVDVSIHAPRAGRDLPKHNVSLPHHVFQSTRPVRGATLLEDVLPRHERFQSTRPVRGATVVTRRVLVVIGVSIHAPRAGRDAGDWYLTCTYAVSIHAPRAGRDGVLCARVGTFCVSIHAPRAGRDTTVDRTISPSGCFNPRAPCGARHVYARQWILQTCFNPRAPCGARLHFQK